MNFCYVIQELHRLSVYTKFSLDDSCLHAVELSLGKVQATQTTLKMSAMTLKNRLCEEEIDIVPAYIKSRLEDNMGEFFKVAYRKISEDGYKNHLHWKKRILITNELYCKAVEEDKRATYTNLHKFRTSHSMWLNERQMGGTRKFHNFYKQPLPELTDVESYLGKLIPRYLYKLSKAEEEDTDDEGLFSDQ